MAGNGFIPAGRTSLVRAGDVQLQVQTEYAQRPAPRITTTVLNSGQVVNKIERTLDHEIASLEEQARIEVTLKRQHLEVIGILHEQAQQDAPSGARAGSVKQEHPTVKCLSQVPGVQRVYGLDNDGNFFSDSGSKEFAETFGPIFSDLAELMAVFSPLAGKANTRESGVYEVERDRLYFASVGSECFFIVVRRVNVTTNYEQEIKGALMKSGLLF